MSASFGSEQVQQVIMSATEQQRRVAFQAARSVIEATNQAWAAEWGQSAAVAALRSKADVAGILSKFSKVNWNELFSPFDRTLAESGLVNWLELEAEDIDTLTELAEDGLPVAWVPSGELIRSLGETVQEDWPSVLLDNETVIIEECLAVIDVTITDKYREQAQVLSRGLSAYRADFIEPAQALAASVLDTVMRNHFGLHQYSLIVQKVEADYDVPIMELRTGLSFAPLIVCLEQYWPKKGHAIPNRFNRHATSHSVGTTQYTRSNSLTSLMLATSILREASELALSGLSDSS